MGRNNRQLQVRGAEGLTLVQSRVLQEMALTTDWREACARVEANPRTVRSWLEHDPAFQDAYAALIGPAISTARDLMESSALKAAGVYNEAMEAIKVIEQEVTCPHCSLPFMTEMGMPDWNSRLRAGDTVMKVARILKDVSEKSVTITHLTMEDNLAIARANWEISQGLQPTIPPAMLERLRPHLKELPERTETEAIPA